MDIRYSLINMRDFFELTQADVAKRCGVTPAAVSHWENGRSTPKYSQIKALADSLGVSVDSILSEDDLESLNESNELLALYNSMSPEGQSALLAAARGLSQSFPRQS